MQKTVSTLVVAFTLSVGFAAPASAQRGGGNCGGQSQSSGYTNNTAFMNPYSSQQSFMGTPYSSSQQQMGQMYQQQSYMAQMLAQQNYQRMQMAYMQAQAEAERARLAEENLRREANKRLAETIRSREELARARRAEKLAGRKTTPDVAQLTSSK